MYICRKIFFKDMRTRKFSQIRKFYGTDKARPLERNIYL